MENRASRRFPSRSGPAPTQNTLQTTTALAPMGRDMNKRSRVRFISDIPIIVTCLTTPGRPIKGRLANLSAHGLSVILNRELPIPSTVRVEWGNFEFVGELIYCQAHGKEFVAGMNVETPVYDTAKPTTDTKSLM